MAYDKNKPYSVKNLLKFIIEDLGPKNKGVSSAPSTTRSSDTGTTSSSYNYVILGDSKGWDIHSTFARLENNDNSNSLKYVLYASGYDNPTDPSTSLSDWYEIRPEKTLGTNSSVDFHEIVHAEQIALGVKDGSGNADFTREFVGASFAGLVELIDMIGEQDVGAAGYDNNGPLNAQIREVVKTLGDDDNATAAGYNSSGTALAELIQIGKAIGDETASGAGDVPSDQQASQTVIQAAKLLQELIRSVMQGEIGDDQIQTVQQIQTNRVSDSGVSTSSSYSYVTLGPGSNDDWQIQSILADISETGGSNSMDYQILVTGESSPTAPGTSTDDWEVPDSDKASGTIAADGDVTVRIPTDAEQVALAYKDGSGSATFDYELEVRADDNLVETNRRLGPIDDAAAGYDSSGSVVAQTREIVKTLGDDGNATAAGYNSPGSALAELIQIGKAIGDETASGVGDVPSDQTVSQTTIQGLKLIQELIRSVMQGEIGDDQIQTVQQVQTNRASASGVSTSGSYNYVTLGPGTGNDWQIQSILADLSETGGNNSFDYRLLVTGESGATDPNTSTDDWEEPDSDEASGTVGIDGDVTVRIPTDAEQIALGYKDGSGSSTLAYQLEVRADDNLVETNRRLGPVDASAAGYNSTGSMVAQTRQLSKTMGDETESGTSATETDPQSAGDMLTKISGLMEGLDLSASNSTTAIGSRSDAAAGYNNNGTVISQLRELVDILGDNGSTDQDQLDPTAAQTLLSAVTGRNRQALNLAFKEGTGTVSGTGSEQDVAFIDPFGDTITETISSGGSSHDNYLDVRSHTHFSLRVNADFNSDGNSVDFTVYGRKNEDADDETVVSTTTISSGNTFADVTTQENIEEFAWLRITENSTSGTDSEVWAFSSSVGLEALGNSDDSAAGYNANGSVTAHVRQTVKSLGDDTTGNVETDPTASGPILKKLNGLLSGFDLSSSNSSTVLGTRTDGAQTDDTTNGTISSFLKGAAGLLDDAIVSAQNAMRNMAASKQVATGEFSTGSSFAVIDDGSTKAQLLITEQSSPATAYTNIVGVVENTDSGNSGNSVDAKLQGRYNDGTYSSPWIDVSGTATTIAASDVAVFRPNGSADAGLDEYRLVAQDGSGSNNVRGALTSKG